MAEGLANERLGVEISNPQRNLSRSFCTALLTVVEAGRSPPAVVGFPGQLAGGHAKSASGSLCSLGRFLHLETSRTGLW